MTFCCSYKKAKIHVLLIICFTFWLKKDILKLNYLQGGFKHIVICLKFCCHHVIMTFPPEWAAALAVICSMCVRAIFNSTFRKHQSLSKSKHNHCQLNKFWTLNSKTHPIPHIFFLPHLYTFCEDVNDCTYFSQKNCSHA